MTDLLNAALAYAARGFLVFPCCPRSKIPATPHGFKDATRDERIIRMWWESVPDYNVAIAAGEDSGLYVLDVDLKVGRSLDEAIESLGFPLPETPTVRTGGGGVQFFFAFPPGLNLSITGGRLGLGIDTRGNGGYVVAPPSIHPSGPAYSWLEFEDSPLAPTPVELIRKLETQKTAALSLSGEKLTGGRHATLMTAAALMRSIGLVPTEILSALKAMVPRLDLRDGRVIADNELRDIADWCADKAQGMVNIEAVTHGEAIAASLSAGFSDAVREVSTADAVMVNPGDFPEHLLHVPGVVGKMCEYINATAMRRQPVLALAASLTAFGALIGRKVRTDFDARSNLYAIGICESSGGKNDARQAVKDLLTEAGADATIGPEELPSDAGVVSALVGQPALIFLLDEIGDLLKAVGSQRAAPHQVAVVSTLLKLYTSANSTFKGKAYADASKNPTVRQPHACVYGTTNPDTFWSAINSEAISNGFLGRALLFVVTDHRPIRQRPAPKIPPPLLVEVLRAWQLYGYGKGNLTAVNPVPAVIGKTPEAEAVFQALSDLEDKEFAALAGSPLRVLWGRVVQKADQLALIAACSRERDGAIIDRDIAQWAADLAVYTTRRMVWECCRYVSQNEHEAKVKKVLRIFESAGEAGLTKDAYTKSTWWLRDRREREEMLGTLVESRSLVLQTVKAKTRPRTVYRLAAYEAEGDTAIIANKFGRIGKEEGMGAASA